DHDIDFSRQESNGDRDPPNLHEVHMTRSVEESKKINDVVAPCIIVSASGMVSGGRVLHHMEHRLPDSRSTVLLVGYQGEGTRGRQLLEGAKYLHLFGESVPVRAQVIEIGQLSAHAGKSELLRWLSGFQEPPKQTFLVHGEPPALNALHDAVKAKFGWNVTIPDYEQSFDLNV
ncbi:MAG TPA: MBL fold metallo-hydrolase RNA specificity domain-containing protein, partial [Candidatus Acidoferrales bacterium]